MQSIKIKDISTGTYFKRKADSARVWVRDYYDRSTKSFSCHAWDDICSEMFIKANKEVFIDFQF